MTFLYRILIVEDDTVISGVITRQLSSWGYECMCVSDFNNIISQFVSAQPHLVLMDISLPFYSGYHWCSEIRKISPVPVIFISSASDRMNIVMAINMGGDDFIAKPFDMDVLTAKVQALLRRTYELSQSVNLTEYKGLVLNTEDATVSYSGKKSSLTKNEVKILSLLLERRGRIVSRDTLMQRLWETDSYVDENTLTVNITRLRKKLDDTGIHDFITTKKGQGYIIQ